ncbi:SDR family oxidoreductase [Gimibacter soli]|uniref:SDR family oxidoreductase n=1 Tax=Gimibacter soli TaxID=3024400 RepID=A0AAE9XVF0_9PROT|nr:SDR family oxidoreductase [Gimibacter soli]WCL54543.1 SDR family oxidoreductase [Gimibacter soli]
MTRLPIRLLVIGPGFTGGAILKAARAAGHQVVASWRNPVVRDSLEKAGIETLDLSGDGPLAPDTLEGVTHLLVSVPPGPAGDPVLQRLQPALAKAGGLEWIGYLSSTNVYGDHGGDWVSEDTPTAPSLERGKRRVVAEAAWQAAGAAIGARVDIFRLAGIYGPGRNAIRSLIDGKARRIVKEGQVFSRIHVADIAAAVLLAMQLEGRPGMVFNLADDDPMPPADVIGLAAEALGVTPPPLEAFETAEMSEMARSFYLESKRVRNDRVKEVLGFAFRYPSIRDALPDLIRSEQR